MTGYFDRKLLDLLPPLYMERDDAGDLTSFLRIPAVTLDELKDLADRFPEIFDVDRCEPRFLPLLSEIVGVVFDPLKDANAQRRLVREAIEIYRRKGSIPAIKRDLVRIGWDGKIEETFHRALRLNRRSVVSQAKLPGQLYSLGVYRIHSENIVQNLRSVLPFHHPAGTRVFFLQWLKSVLDMDLSSESLVHALVERICIAYLNETFVLNRHELNTDYHLTRKQKTSHLWQITNSVTLTQEFEAAHNCLRRWHGRTPRFKLNSIPLNTERLQNLWVSERKRSLCCIIDPRRHPTDPSPAMRMAGQDLNGSRLNASSRCCYYCFKQKDLHATDEAPLSEVEADGRLHEYAYRSRLSHWFRMGHSRTNGLDRISGAWVGREAMLTAMAVFDWASVREAHDVVDRWRGRRPGFNLNNRMLNTTELTDAYVTEARAAFELDVDTGYPRRHRTEPLTLNRKHLNHTGLLLSVDRTKPMRLCSMKLNESGFRVAKSSFRWRTRQRDDHAEALSGIEAAANLYTVTQWPTG